MSDYPQMAAAQIEPAPRRIRGVLANRTVFDTTAALYVWEWPNYPQYYIPLDDVDRDLLVDEQHRQKLRAGTSYRYGLQVGDTNRPGAVRFHRNDADKRIVDTARFDWAALDSWFEEDEEIFVHPRNPYTRVDAIRSSRPVRVELDGVVLAQTASPVMVFETGLPTRYYVPRTDIRFEHLVATDTVTECPYKGTTTGYWSIRTAGTTHPDLAWSYNFPTRQLLPIAGMIAFYNEKVDHILDGQLLERPVTHFFH
jgi:uncharacterized protein (DUF427 family)